ncbi:hypothetical protein HGRIS_001779 [Hohenbuehelia grisea]|uniref:Mitochondrial import inner membrane translocase subunit TIM50 n=1 Tax=Hohenbuehelia grisea TaxID=104357 RepID=A0ABR3JJF5_9AGAR
MFAVLARPLARQAAARSVRCLSQAPPPPRQPPPPGAPSEGSSKPAENGAPDSADLKEESTDPPPPLQPGALPSLDISPLEPPREQGGGQRTGARSSRDTLSSAELKRRNFGRVAMGVFALGFGLNAIYMGREYEDEELKDRKMTLETAPTTRWGRTADRFTQIFDVFNKPAWQELLPPQPPPPHAKPYTLLVSLDDLLVTSTWDRQHGWRTAKRPGVDYFLAYISQFYEVVIFTSQHSYTAIPVLEKLDRYNFFITHKLFRDATRSINGQIVKDLSYLNRDLSNVVLLDTHPEHVTTHPENAIIMPKWTGDPSDKGLVAMIPFLESLAIYKAPDVRPILQAYADKNIPLEYAKKEAEAKQRHVEEWSKKHKGLSTGQFTFSSLFGGSSEGRSSIPPTYLEQKRKEAQMLYREEQAYIATNKEQFEKLLEQDQAAAAQGVPNSLWEMVSGAKPDNAAAPGASPATPAAGGATPPSAGVAK